MAIWLLIVALVALVACIVLLKIHARKGESKIWLVAPVLLGVLLFTITSVGVVLTPPERGSSAEITINLIPPIAIVSDIVHQELGDYNRGEMPKIQGVDVRGSENGYIVTVRFSIDTVSTEALIRNIAQTDAHRVMRELYQSSVPIAYVKMVGTFPLEDAYGIVRETEVLNCELSSATAQKIRWNRVHNNDLFDLLDTLWWHPSFLEMTQQNSSSSP